MPQVSDRDKYLMWTAAGLGGGMAVYNLVQKAREMRLKNKVVLITGATRGLGLQLAREFAGQGAQLAICGRDVEALRAAATKLRGRRAQVLATVVDVSVKDQVDEWVAHVNEHYGQIDILVNNAGTIQVGPAVNMTLQDYEEAMQLMFYGHLYGILAVLPQMQNRKTGAIVNITSIGGKVSVPHLLPYCCAKFAATALSQGLYEELKSDGIHVLTVAPGLLRTGSYVNAYFRGQLEKELAWFASSEGSPLMAMDPPEAARQIVQALKSRQPEVILGANAQLLARLSGAFPNFTADLLSYASKLLPTPGEGDKTKGIDLQHMVVNGLTGWLAQRNQENVKRYHQPA